MGICITHLLIGVTGIISNVYAGAIIGVILSVIFVLVGWGALHALFRRPRLLPLFISFGMFYSTFWGIAFIFGAIFSFAETVSSLYVIPLWGWFIAGHFIAVSEPGVNPANWKGES